MTVLVGILSKDGAVIGADSAATFAHGNVRTIEQQTQKLDVIADQIIVAGTGQIGLGQRFVSIVEEAWQQKKFQSQIQTGKYLSATAIQDFASTHVKQGDYGALVACPCKKEICLCEFAPQDFQPEWKTDRLWYVSMGSGQSITDPFLGFIRNVFWNDNELPSLQDAKFAVTWALQHAIELNTGGIKGPIQMAVISRDNQGGTKARLLDDDEISTHEGNVKDAIEHLREYRDILQARDTGDVPDIPRPKADQ